MSKTLQAVYDGEVLRPDEPLGLAPDTRVRITIELMDEQRQPLSFLDTALGLNLDGPPDWSERFDDYLYSDKETCQ